VVEHKQREYTDVLETLRNFRDQFSDFKKQALNMSNVLLSQQEELRQTKISHAQMTE
jgi:hypothetical protein